MRRRALLFPYFLAGLSFTGWTLAGLIWGVAWPLLAGVFTRRLAAPALRQHRHRGRRDHRLHLLRERASVAAAPARFFPEGDLSAVRACPGWRCASGCSPSSCWSAWFRSRFSACWPTRARLALLGADPAAAAEIVDGLSAGHRLPARRSGSSPRSGSPSSRPAAWRRRSRTWRRRWRRWRGAGSTAAAPVVSNDEIGAVAEGFNRMLQGLREREIVKETFGKYVTPEIRDEILAGRVRGEGERVEATMLFADLRDFTPWVEATAPREVVRDLNEYFTEMDQAIRAHGGLVLQYIGDEIEAVFGAPDRRPPTTPRGRCAPRSRCAGGSAPGTTRREAAGRAAAAPRHRHPHRHRAGRQYRQRRAALLRPGRRPGEPRLAHPGAHQGLQGRHPDQRRHPRPPRRRGGRSRSCPRCASRAGWKR